MPIELLAATIAYIVASLTIYHYLKKYIQKEVDTEKLGHVTKFTIFITAVTLPNLVIWILQLISILILAFL